MGGVEKIIQNILAESEEAAKQSILQAKAQAEATVAKAVSDVEKKSEAIIARANKEAEEEKSRAASIAALEGRKQILAAKREVMDEVFDRLELYFMQLKGTEYINFLSSLAKGSSGGELIFSEKDKNIAVEVKNKLGDNFSVCEKTENRLKSGYIIKNGDVETNCSIQAVVTENRRRLEPGIAHILFNNEAENE
ncbi:MAG: hypothetical protein DBX47_05050 [Clostridiales bacterium]|nr:MAG: hypothetical protein DBX47_05050 [Clostridiales bacterium]